MNWNELRRIVENNGFVFAGHGKKHDIYRNPETGQRVLIERHWSQEVRKGIAHKILKEVQGK